VSGNNGPASAERVNEIQNDVLLRELPCFYLCAQQKNSAGEQQ
jgi:hypothetical protein